MSDTSSAEMVSKFSVADPSTIESPFTPTCWVRSHVKLLENGILEITNAESGSLIRQQNIRLLFMSGIRRLDYSVFQLPDIIYIGEYPQHANAGTSHHHKAPPQSIPSNSISNSGEHKSGHGKHLAENTIIKHTRNHTHSHDTALYLKFHDTEDSREWMLALKKLPRLQVYSPSTGDPSKSFRLARFLTFRILEARVNAIDKTPHCTYPELYVEIVFGSRIWGRTSVSPSTKSPFWREDFIYRDIDTPEIPTIFFHVRRRIKSADPYNDPLIATVTLTNDDLKKNGNRETWYKLEGTGTAENDEGSLCVKILLEEMPIVASKHYDGVKAALKSLSDESLALLNLSEDYLPRGDITSMSDICLNMALATPTPTQVIKWISALISQDIIKTRLYIVKKQGRDCFREYCTIEQHEFKQNLLNSMFRGNNILTKSLEKFMRMVGRVYLTGIIGVFVQSVVDARPDLEIDPARMKLSSPPDNLSAADKEALAANQAKLLEYTTRLWNLIKNAVDGMPMSFKIIFRHLSDELVNNLQMAEKGVNNSIAGFLFLRFFCPGLLNPKLFGFIDAQQAAAVHRPLTLITKVIQAFANRSRFGLKEPYMIPMNVFFDEHEDELQEYYQNVKLDGKTESEIEELEATDFQYARPSQSDSSSLGGVPLSEHIYNPFLLDEHLNYARFFEVWKKVLEVNREDIFARIEEFTTQEEALMEGVLVDSEEQSDEVMPTSNISANAKVSAKIAVTKTELNRLFDACYECHQKVERIVSDLKDKTEEFNVDDVPKYCRHMSLLWNLPKGTLKHVKGISADNDWFSYNELQTSPELVIREQIASVPEHADPIKLNPSVKKSLNPDVTIVPPGFDFSQRRRSHSSPNMPSVDPEITSPIDLHSLSIPHYTSPLLKGEALLPEDGPSAPTPTSKTSATHFPRSSVDQVRSDTSTTPGASEASTSPPTQCGSALTRSFSATDSTASSMGGLNSDISVKSNSGSVQTKRLPKWFKNWP